jgi:hypothetical protein
MRFFSLFFFFFVTFVSSFDFDYNDSNDVSSNVEISVAEVVPATSTSATTVAVVPDANTTESKTTTTASTTTIRTTTTEKEAANETRREAPTFNQATEGQSIGLVEKIEQLTTSTTIPQDFGKKVEVVITKSIFRLIDEAFRARLINFESRIAGLLDQRERMKDEISNFTPKFDESFLDKAFDSR